LESEDKFQIKILQGPNPSVEGCLGIMAVEAGEMVKDLVLGCVQSWLGRYGREDIVKLVSENFLDKEIFEGLKSLCVCMGLEPPKTRRNTMKQVAVKVWGAEIYDIMMKEDYAEKLPEFVVSSQELQRVPLALLSGANDVVPICSRMNSLEKKMEDMVDTMMKFTKGQILSAMQASVALSAPSPSGSYASVAGQSGAVQPGVGQQGLRPPGTPRVRVGSFSDVAAALKRKHEEVALNGQVGQQGQQATGGGQDLHAGAGPGTGDHGVQDWSLFAKILCSGMVCGCLWISLTKVICMRS
jgi:hypothetical protein